MNDDVYVKEIANKFNIYGSFVKSSKYGKGHINSTFMSIYNQAGTSVRYIHQRINNKVFEDPKVIMQNIHIVTNHIRKKVESLFPRDFSSRALTLVPTKDGNYYYVDKDNYVWRTYFFVGNSKCFESVESTDVAEIAAESFAKFQIYLFDLDPSLLKESIEYFHDGYNRFKNFKEAVNLDPLGRAKECAKEIDGIMQLEKDFYILEDLKRSGKITTRITHNDTKINNILIDEERGEGICILDLDTVMSGIIHFDFGDMVRTITATAAEDEIDLSKVGFSFSRFQAMSEGYIRVIGNNINETEKKYLAFSGKYLTLELASRFLVDYLMGDVYFKIKYPEHNLNRARCQFKLTQVFAENLDRMQDYIDKLS